MSATARITGLGFVSCLGCSRKEVAQRLKQGISGIGDFPHRWSSGSRVRSAGALPGYDFTSADRRTWTFPALPEIPRLVLRGAAPHGIMAFHALTDALEDAGIDVPSTELSDAGLYCASAGSPMMLHHYVHEMIASGGQRIHPSGVLSSIAGTLNFMLGAAFGIRGGNCGFVSACSSAAHALGYAVDDLRLGRIETALVVAAEDLNAESLLPFAGMRALSESEGPQASRPFDVDRDGFVPSGGAVALVLQRTSKGHGYAGIQGWAQRSDGFDPAVSHPDGDGLFRAMQALLQQEGIEPGAIDYINAHATSTRRGDLSEIRALRRLLGESSGRIPVSSTKGITGHALSMSGALEIALCALMIKDGFIAGNPHLANPDPEAETLLLPRESQTRPLRCVLSNSSGFGGSNVCVLLKA